MIIDLSSFYKETGTAKLADIPMYKEKIKEVDVYGQVVTLTGAAPIWLYLTLACVLQDKVTKLIYNSPVTGDVVVFGE